MPLLLIDIFRKRNIIFYKKSRSCNGQGIDGVGAAMRGQWNRQEEKGAWQKVKEGAPWATIPSSTLIFLQFPTPVYDADHNGV